MHPSCEIAWIIALAFRFECSLTLYISVL